MVDQTLQEAAEEAIDENPDAVADYEDDVDGAVMFLVGQVMQKTGGEYNPSVVSDTVRSSLGEQRIESIDVVATELVSAIYSRFRAGDQGLLIEVTGSGEYRMTNVVNPDTASQSQNPILSPEGFVNDQTWEIVDAVEIDNQAVEVNVV